MQANVAKGLLDSWARERARGVEDAAALTSLNGKLCNETYSLLVLLLWIHSWLLMIPWINSFIFDPQVDVERAGYRPVSNGFFLREQYGGTRLPQIYIDTLQDKRLLSDNLLTNPVSIFTLLVLDTGLPERPFKIGDLKTLLKEEQIPEVILSSTSISILGCRPSRPDTLGHFSEKHTGKASPTASGKLPHSLVRPGYSEEAMLECLGASTRFVIVRPDMYVFATSRDSHGLRHCLSSLRSMCGIN